MVGQSMIGDSRNATRYRITSLPAEARNVTRMLRLLGHKPELACGVLLEGIPDEFAFKAVVKETLDEMGRYGWNRFAAGLAESRMSMTLMYAIQTHLLQDSEHTATKKQKKNSHTSRAVSSSSSSETLVAPDGKGPQTTTLEARDVTAALVSDYSVASDEEEEQQRVVAANARSIVRSQQARRIWSLILESLHLQVSARTTVVWGRKKIYEIYQLISPVKPLPQELSGTCKTISKEFCSVHQTECRVYAHRSSQNQVYFQLNIGKSFDLHDASNRGRTGVKKKPKPNEYIALVDEGSCLLALTAGRRASAATCRFTKFVLVALEAALGVSARPQYEDGRENKKKIPASMVPNRFGTWTGTEPHDLLGEAQNSQEGRAVGRFAKLARLGPDPLTEFHQVSTESLLSRKEEQERLDTGRRHGRHVAQLARHGAVAAHSNGVLVDGSAKRTESRKRARQAELGDDGDCPKMQRVAWKWSGTFEEVEFKCGVVMEGSNVFEGLGELVKAGLTKETLPDYVKDAPALGSSIITVDHGEYGGAESFAAV